MLGEPRLYGTALGNPAELASIEPVTV